MPNHCGTTLRIVLPPDEDLIDSLVQSLEGPNDWFFPVWAYEGLAPLASAHERLTTLHATAGIDVAALRADLSQRLAGVGAPPVPDWMPLCLHTYEKATEDPSWVHDLKHAPLSFPRLMGDLDPELFFAYSSGVGTPDPSRIFVPEFGTRRSEVDICRLRNAVLGTKWGAYDIVFDSDEDILRFENRAVLTFRYTTAWGPISCIETAFEKVLRAHQARLLLWWDDGGGSYGAAHFDPEEDSYTEWEIQLSPRDLSDAEHAEAIASYEADRDDDADMDDGADNTDDGDEAEEDATDGGDDPFDVHPAVMDLFYERCYALLEEKAIERADDPAFSI